MMIPTAASAAADAYAWTAFLADGTTLAETDAAGGVAVRGMGDVERDQVLAFRLTPTREGLRPAAVAIDLAAGERLVFTRRRQMAVRFDGGEPEPLQTIHVLGVQQPDGRGAYQFLFEDGTALLSTDFQAL